MACSMHASSQEGPSQPSSARAGPQLLDPPVLGAKVLTLVVTPVNQLFRTVVKTDEPMLSVEKNRLSMMVCSVRAGAKTEGSSCGVARKDRLLMFPALAAAFCKPGDK